MDRDGSEAGDDPEHSYLTGDDMDYQSVLSEVKSWSVDDRLRLVQEVWEQLPEHIHGSDISDEMKAELDRRIEEMDRSPESGVPWEVVKANIVAQFQR